MILELYKVLRDLNITSRRKSTDAIKEGRVKVNEKVAKDPLLKVDTGKDSLVVNGKKVDLNKIDKKEYVYYLLNKPRGFITTVKDAHKRKTVLDLVKEKKRIYPVGRLDKDTEGLLILTNDGNLTYRLLHPKFKIDKVYEAIIIPVIKGKDIAKLKRGVIIDEDIKVKAQVKLLKIDKKNQSKLELTIHQGLKRQIRKMLAVLGYKVIELARFKVGPIEIGDLKKGEYRRLSPYEINLLKKEVGIKDG